MKQHVVMFSGGAASWAEAKLAAQRYGPDRLTLLFTDTRVEDHDLYRFLDEAAANVGAPLVRIADGRDIWDVFRDERFLGNSRTAPCSKLLKARVGDAYLAANASPETHALHFGFTWDEPHRIAKMRAIKAPYEVEALLADSLLMRDEIFDWMHREGLRRPRLYDLGLEHNNCGGGCVRAGKRHWAHVLRALPDVYAEWERNEQSIRDHVGQEVTMLRDESLRSLRERLQGQPALFGADEIMRDDGACGCYIAGIEGTA